MAWCCRPRWCCWLCLLFCGQGVLLVVSALLHLLYRVRVQGGDGLAEAGLAMAPAQEDLLQEAAVPLLRPWLWKYGAGSARLARKPEAWVLCPGRLKRRQIEALKPKVGNSYVISLNRYFYPPVYRNYGLMPTHHWHADVENVLNGFCLKELKKAQKNYAAKKVQKDNSKITVMKFEAGYGDCYVAQEAAIAAAKNGVQFISTKSLIALLRAMKIPPMNPFLHEEQEWLEDHPLPLTMGDLTLLHGISIAVSLTPQGSTIKLVGCSGYKKSEHFKKESKQIREKVKLLEKAGPGWDVVNCDPKSEYVKLGAMPGATCSDSHDSEYDLEAMHNFTR